MLEIVVALLPHSLLLLVILVPCLDIIPVQPIGLPHRMRVPIALLALPLVGLGRTCRPERHRMCKLGRTKLRSGNLTDLHTRHREDMTDNLIWDWMFGCCVPKLTLGLRRYPVLLIMTLGLSTVIPGFI